MQHIPGNRQLGKCPPHGGKMLALNMKTRITLVLRPFAVLPVTYDLFDFMRVNAVLLQLLLPAVRSSGPSDTVH